MFNATLVGDTALIVRLKTLPKSVFDALYTKVLKLSLALQAHIVRDKLAGQVLGVVSGDLRRSIQQKMDATEMAVFGVVYSAGDVKYAGAHEFGFDGDVTVKQHTRTMVFGKEAALPFSVGPYTMHMKMPERSFMRSSLTDMKEEISTGMKEAAIEGLQRGAPS